MQHFCAPESSTAVHGQRLVNDMVVCRHAYREKPETRLDAMHQTNPAPYMRCRRLTIGDDTLHHWAQGAGACHRASSCKSPSESRGSPTCQHICTCSCMQHQKRVCAQSCNLHAGQEGRTKQDAMQLLQLLDGAELQHFPKVAIHIRRCLLLSILLGWECRAADVAERRQPWSPGPLTMRSVRCRSCARGQGRPVAAKLYGTGGVGGDSWAGAMLITHFSGCCASKAQSRSSEYPCQHVCRHCGLLLHSVCWLALGRFVQTWASVMLVTCTLPAGTQVHNQVEQTQCKCKCDNGDLIEGWHVGNILHAGLRSAGEVRISKVRREPLL